MTDIFLRLDSCTQGVVCSQIGSRDVEAERLHETETENAALIVLTFPFESKDVKMYAG